MIYRSIPIWKQTEFLLNDSCKWETFRRLRSLLPFFLSFTVKQKRERSAGPLSFLFLGPSWICIIRGLSTGSHEQWMQVHNEDANRFARMAVIFVSRPCCPLSLLEHVFQAAIAPLNRATPLIFLPDILPRVSSSPKKRKNEERLTRTTFGCILLTCSSRIDDSILIDIDNWTFEDKSSSHWIKIQHVWKFIWEFIRAKLNLWNMIKFSYISFESYKYNRYLEE